MKNIIVLALIFNGAVAQAWGNRGHEIVATIAAKLLEEKKQYTYLADYEFHLGYYANVPDIIWRNLSKEIGDTEAPTHYFDWNQLFVEKFGKIENLPVDFAEYKSKMGSDYDRKLGLSPWRVQDLFVRAKNIVEKADSDWQIQALVHMGTLCHYVGDASQPLHVTDNHDGQKSGQNGIHAYFETTMVNALDPELKPQVLKEARILYAKAKQSEKVEAIFRNLMADSYRHIDEILQDDKRVGRDDVKKSKEKYRMLIVNRLAHGAVATALIWDQILSGAHDWKSKGFYDFQGAPKYVILNEGK